MGGEGAAKQYRKTPCCLGGLPDAQNAARPGQRIIFVLRHARYLAFDALRGVAAIAVLFHHAERELHLPELFAYGYLAVDFFFLMSGFVIAAAYDERMRGGLSLPAFVRIRLARLYPMMALGGVLGIVASFWTTPGDPQIWLAGLSALFMIPLLWNAPVLFPANIPEWSIFFELVTNFLHCGLARILTMKVLIGIIVASFLALLVAGWKLHGLANGYSPDTFWGGFPRTFLSYFGGVLLHRTRAVWQKKVPPAPFALLVCAFPAIVLAAKFATQWVPASAYFLLAVLVLNPMLLMLLATVTPGKRATAWCEGMGALSYPLYAIHVPLLVLAAPYVVDLSLPARYAIGTVICMAIAVIALGTQARIPPMAKAPA